MLLVGDGTFVAFGEVLDALRVFLLVALRARDVPLYPALRDGSELLWRDLKCKDVVLRFERSDHTGYGYALADHALTLVPRGFCLYSTV